MTIPWEVEHEINLAEALYYKLCQHHHRQSGLLEFLRASHPEIIQRIALELDLGQMTCPDAANKSSIEAAESYILHALSKPMSQACFYGLDVTPWVKPPILSYFKQQEDWDLYYLYHELPASLKIDMDVVNAAVMADEGNIYLINNQLIEQINIDVFTTKTNIFSTYLRKEGASAIFAA